MKVQSRRSHYPEGLRPKIQPDFQQVWRIIARLLSTFSGVVHPLVVFTTR